MRRRLLGDLETIINVRKDSKRSIDDVRSFDVFDTVLMRRLAAPTDALVLLGYTLAEKKLIDILPLEFAALRRIAHKRAINLKPFASVTLEDIYSCFGCDAELSKRIAEEEILVEQSLLVPVPGIEETLKAARHQAGRIVFISDMYLPSLVIQDWLSQWKLFLPGDLIFVSVEYGSDKSSGSLYKIVQKRLGVAAENWVHVGDSLAADVKAPSRLGIKTIHFSDALLTRYESQIRGTIDEFADLRRSFSAGAVRLCRLEGRTKKSSHKSLWNIGAGVMAPFFYSFARWVLEEAEHRGISELYFLSRDGQSLLIPARQISAEKQLEVQCRYLYGSRAAFLPSQEVSQDQALTQRFSGHPRFQSIASVLELLHIELQFWGANCPPELQNVNLEINLLPEQRKILVQWLCLPQIKDAIREIFETLDKKALGYMRQEIPTGKNSFALVDTGWGGTIQSYLEKILSPDGNSIRLTGFYIAFLSGSEERVAGKMMGFTNSFGSIPFRTEGSARVIIEMFCPADHPQVTGFQKKDGQWVPVFDETSKVEHEFCSLIQSVIERFGERAAEIPNRWRANIEESAQWGIQNFNLLHEFPSREEANTISSLTYSAEAIDLRRVSLCRPMETIEIIHSLLDFRRRPSNWWIGGQAATSPPIIAKLLHAFRAHKIRKKRISGITD